MAVVACVIGLLFVSGSTAALGRLAQASSPAPREALVLSQERTGVVSPAGLAFSPASSAFYVVGAGSGRRAETEVAKLTPFKLSSASDRSGTTRIAATLSDPINVAFDARGKRLLLLSNPRELLEVQAGSGGDLERHSVRHRSLARLGLEEPQGIAVDPATGALFVLDTALSRIVRVERGSGGFQGAPPSQIDLRPTGLSGVRGLAFDSDTGNLYLTAGSSLVELTQTGEVASTRDLSGLALARPEGMVFAPSADRTDDPAELSLYLADSGAGRSGSAAAPTVGQRPAPSAGQILELSLTPIPTAASDFTSSLVNTIDMGALDPPSPDPSGITYVSAGDKLVISDGEVEEIVEGITHFQGANVWELTRSGSIIRTANISKVEPTDTPMTDEPTGTAWKPSNGHYFVTEDGGKKVYDLNPGVDGLVGTSDDTWTFFRTNILPNDNGDPEGITYDSINDRLFVADGVNREIYQYTTTGTLVSHFDVQQYGVEDPETVEFDPATGTLFTLSNRQSGPIIVETTTSGALIQTIDVSAAGAIKPAGLAWAPASDGSGLMSFYFVDRGIDNNSDPNAVDGKMYEMTTPGRTGPGSPPLITSDGGGVAAALSRPENQAAVTDVNAAHPDPAATITYSISGGADAARFTIDASTGVLTFIRPPDFENPTDAGADNVYEVVVRATRGSLFDEQAIVVTVTDVAERPG